MRVAARRKYASRLLNEQDRFAGSDGFYRRLEPRLGHLVESRTKQFFVLESVPPPTPAPQDFVFPFRG